MDLDKVQREEYQTLKKVTAYRLNHPNGPFTFYAQHNDYFHSTGKTQCPRKAFLQDLYEDTDTLNLEIT